MFMTLSRFFVPLGLGVVLVGCSRRLDVGDRGDGAEERIAMARSPSVVALGYLFGCALLEDTTVACWGFNRYGQTGTPPEDSLDSLGNPRVLTPTRVPELDDVVQLTAGPDSTYALRADGKVFGWGNTTWTPGENAPAAHPTPREVPGVSDVVKVADGGGPVCALRRDGTVVCWGDNTYLSVGPGSGSAEVLAPTTVEGIADAVDVAVGRRMSCVRHRDGNVSCWGVVHIVADAFVPNSPVPVRIGDVHEAVDLAVADAAAMALLEDGTVMGWGADDADGTALLSQIYGERAPSGLTDVATGIKSDGVPPAVFPGLAGIASVRAKASTMCTLVAADGSVLCWGKNSDGELGQERTTPPVLEPTRIENVTASQLEVGVSHSCFVDDDRRLWCWGSGLFGALGTGQSEALPRNVTSPVLLPAPLARPRAPTP